MPENRSRILIVDDDRDNAKMFRIMLGQCDDFIVDTAFDGEEALKMYTIAKHKEEPYDLLLLDLAMPFMNGFELEEKIRSIGDYQIKVVFFSAHIYMTDWSTHQESIDRACGKWPKPIDAKVFCKLVKDVLAKE